MMKTLARAVAVAVAALVLIALLGIGLFYYAFSIPEPEGRSLASWPSAFTENFAGWIHEDDGIVEIDEIGIRYLDEYGLWLQVLSGDGAEAYKRNVPSGLPVRYSAADLAELSTSPFDGRFTKFVGSTEAPDGGCYIIGFPYPIGKGEVFYNGAAVDRMYSVAAIAGTLLAVLLVAAIVIYGIWITRKLRHVVAGVEDVARRTYRPQSPKGAFGPVSCALNELDSEIRASDEAVRKTERMRREWIENITHDMRTPLSPIKGYAELLSNGAPTEADMREGGRIVLRNAERIDSLVGDLKLAYEIDGDLYPLRRKTIPLERLVRECIIDMVNAEPTCADAVEFSSLTHATVKVDVALLSRAVGNILANALRHNPPGTRVTVRVEDAQPGWCAVEITDDGGGIAEEDLPRLFERHWKGSQNEAQSAGSGLGLAIAREVAELHGGHIRAESTQGSGAMFRVELPICAAN